MTSKQRLTRYNISLGTEEMKRLASTSLPEPDDKHTACESITGK